MNWPGERLFLIGGRGAGKTTVGRLLAERVGWGFIDADDALRQREGRSIAAIFAEDSEEYFRKRESALMAELASSPDVVIATGGGVVLAAPNRELLRSSGFTAWLNVSPPVAHERIAADPASELNRPSLTGLSTLADLHVTLRAREPLYRDASHAAVDTDGQSPSEVVSAILAAWRSWPTCR